MAGGGVGTGGGAAFAAREAARRDILEGGRGGSGDVDRREAESLASGCSANTWERAGRDLSRDCVGIVRRRAAVFADGVEGRVGGTLKSWIRLVELLCDFALEAAVGSSYLGLD